MPAAAAPAAAEPVPVPAPVVAAPAAKSRKRRASAAEKARSRADSEADHDSAAEGAQPRPKRARAVAGSSRSAAKKKKGAEAAAAAAAAVDSGLVAVPPVILEKYQWLQCDEKMCGKWRKLKEGPFADVEAAFPPLLPAPHADPEAIAALAAFPLPRFVSLHPLTFGDVSAGKFYCHMNPDLFYAHCSAEEETADGEVTLPQ